MTRRRFLLDENMSRAVRHGLRRRNPLVEVHMVGAEGAPPRGTPDSVLLLWMEEHGFSLVTNNRASMPGHLADHLSSGRHTPAVFVMRPRTPIGAVIDDLFLIWSAADPDEYADQVVWVPL